MNNGQLNSVSMPTAMPLATQEPTAPVAVALDGVQQDGGNFAGLLSGIQTLAKMKASPDSGQTEPPMAMVDEDQLTRLAATENLVVDLLSLLNDSPQIISASEPAPPEQEDSEKVDISSDAVPQGFDPSDVASKMAIAAYSPPGRMPEATIPTPLAVDMLQKVVVAVTEQPIEKQSIKPSVPLAEEQQQRHQPEAVQRTSADGQPVKSLDAEPVAARVFQPVEYDRMSNVNIPTQLHVDRLQNVAAVPDQPALFSVPPEKMHVEQSGAVTVQVLPAQTPVPPSATAAQVSAVPYEPIVPSGTIQADLSATAAGKPVESVTTQSGLPAAHLTDQLTEAVPESSPESEIEIHLSQPRPITARVTATAQQQRNPEQQIDKVTAGTEQSTVKEMALSRQMPVPDSESTLGKDTSRGSGSNQEQSDVGSDNQTLTQDMRGQLRTEPQRAAVSTTKEVPAAPLRQDIPEQVVQQVKERLVQHDLKPGNQQITLTLSPDSLGELKMNLNLQGQKLSVEIVTENRAVRDAIVQHTDALKESLARQNITMESFDVTTGGKGSGNQGQNQNAWRELAKQQHQQQFWTSSRGYQTAQADLPSDNVAYQRNQGQTMLDIHY